MREQATRRFAEREQSGALSLTTPDGKLASAAIGWWRQPQLVTELGGGFGRRKRWEYWGVLSERAMFAITLADFDYVGLAAVSLLDFASGRLVERALLTPLALGMRMPQQIDDRQQPVRFAALGLTVEMTRDEATTRLAAEFGSGKQRLCADLRIERRPAVESLSVVIPWSERRYQYTSKHVGLPARGAVTLGAERYEFSPERGAVAVLDHGRGRWPWRSAWIWACAPAPVGKGGVGLNLGGRWTDGTGLTENGLFIDGRVEKISEELEFSFARGPGKNPWTIRAPSGRLKLDFQPLHRRQVGALLPGMPVGAKLNWNLGLFNGFVINERGESLAISDKLGWAEELVARW